MHTRKLPNLVGLTSILLALQSLFIILKFQDCLNVQPLTICAIAPYNYMYGYPHLIYILLTYAILILFIIAFIKSLVKKRAIGGILISALVLKVFQILIVFINWSLQGGSIQNPIRFILGYSSPWFGYSSPFWVFNPLLCISIFGSVLVLVFAIFYSNQMKQSFNALPYEADQIESIVGNAPKVAPGWYPNALANNAVMYWDGSAWLNIPAPVEQRKQNESSGLAIASFVTAFFVPILPIVLGHISLSNINRSSGRIGGKGLAIAGLVLGYVALIGWALIIFGLFAAASDPYSDY